MTSYNVPRDTADLVDRHLTRVPTQYKLVELQVTFLSKANKCSKKVKNQCSKFLNISDVAEKLVA